MNNRVRRRMALVCAVAVITLPAAPQALRAASLTWDGGSHNFQWSSPNNWTGNVEPASKDTVTFPATVPDDLATIVLSNGEAVHRIIFNNNYDLTGGSLDLGVNDPFTFNPRITTAPGTSVFIDTTLTSGPSGYGLEKYGSGKLTLLGTNTFVGGVVVAEGILAINSDAALGGANNGVAFRDGSVLTTTASLSTSRSWNTTGMPTINVTSATTLTHNGHIGGASALIRKIGAGTLALALADDQEDARIRLDEGTVRVAANNGAGLDASIIGNVGTTLDLAGFNQIMYLDGDTSVINSGVATSALSSGGDFNGTISGNIALSVVNAYMYLRSPNSYTGGTTVNGGTVIIAADNRLGVAGTNLALNNGGLRATESFSISRPLVIGPGVATFEVDAGKELSITGSVTGGGAMNKTGEGNLVLGGAIPSGHSATTITAGTLTLVKTSPGTIAAPGDVILGDGTGSDLLVLSQSEQIGDAANMTVASSGILSMGTATETIAGLTMTGGQVSGAAATLRVLNDVTINASPASVIIAPKMDLAGVAHVFTVADGAAPVDLRVEGEIYSGDLLKIGAGRMDVQRFRDVGVLTIGNGTVGLLEDGTEEGVSIITSFSRGSAAKLDLRNNRLIIRSGAIGSWGGSAYTGISGHIDAGRGNASNAQWDGSGIVTSDTRAVNNNDLCSIGVALVSQVRGIAATATAAFGGQTVHGDDVLVMFTWGGDATLDGKINIDDYGRIDGNVANSGSVFGWYNGDFNYDGKINIDDYGIIDGNISQQGASFVSNAGGETVVAVPEPVGAGLVIGIGGLLHSIRRRRFAK